MLPVFIGRNYETLMSKKRLEDYHLLSAITASPAPNPAKMPARGTGVDVCAGGWLIGEVTGCG